MSNLIIKLIGDRSRRFLLTGQIVIYSFILFIFTSCEKVIDINLNSSDPKLVIEAEISNQKVCTVKLTKTIDFDVSNNFPPVEGASITLTDDLGNSEVLSETSSGIYKTKTILGTPGRIYTITVIDQEKTYSAVSSMSNVVAMDTITFEKMGAFGNSTNIANIKFNDPAGIKNYYRFIEEVNGITQNTIFIYEDRFEDGKSISTSLFNDPGHGGDNTTIEHGDSVKILIQCIDKGVYDYFSSLNQLSGGMQSSTPANPSSNFSNGALGYFNAYSFDEKSVIVP